MAFNNSGTLSPYGAPVLRSGIIANSVAAIVNQSLKTASGFLALGTTGALVFGHIVEIGTSKGMPMNSTGVAGAEFGSYLGAFTVASDNQTVAMVRATCDVSKNTLYSALNDDTTASALLLGYMMDIADAVTLDSSTASESATMQYNGWGADPLSATRSIVNIYESKVFGV